MKRDRDPIRRWIEQEKHGRTQRREFRNGNIGYHDDVVTSYNWWPMARIIDHKKKVALYRMERYSVSTARHQSFVGTALLTEGFKTFHVARVTSGNSEYGGDLRISDHMANLEDYERRIGRRLESADRSRKYKPLEMAMAQAIITEMGDYIEYFGLDREEPDVKPLPSYHELRRDSLMR